MTPAGNNGTTLIVKWAQTIVKYRVPFMIMGIILTGIFVYGISLIRVNVVLEDMFPYGHPFIKLHKEFGSQFGGASTILIELKVLGRLALLLDDGGGAIVRRLRDALVDPVKTDAVLLEQLRERFGLDRPLLEQLWIYLKGYATFYLGFSYRQQQPVLMEWAS